MIHKKRRVAALATLTVVALVAAGCSSDKKTTTASGANSTAAPTATTAGSTATTAAPATTAPATTGGPATTGKSASTTTGSSGASTTTAGSQTATTVAGNPDANHSVPDTAGAPVPGGKLVVGIDSDSANPWAPYRTSCAGSCFAILSAISDTLFGITDKNEPVPVLVKSVDHNADYTQWVLHLRDGIKFHDGTPLDADAVKFNLDTCLNSPLTASAYTAIEKVAASGQDVTLTMRGGPWVALPVAFTWGQCSYMFSKKWLSSLPDVPQRNDKAPIYDAALAATPADGDPAKPVGLGAFKFDSYTPGNGNSFKATKNPDYWRGKNGITGEDLPYLDSYEAVVYVDIQSRQNAVRSGDVNTMETANADSIKTSLADKSLKTTSSNKGGETGYILLNVAEGDTDPKGANAKSPLLKLPCRQALAAAIDTTRWAQERGGAIEAPANGPFPPGSVGYLADTGYPKFDVAAAQKYMDQCLSETGGSSIDFTFNTTNDPFNVESNQLVISMWKDAFGDKVKTNITPIEQGQYIGLALTGAYQAFGWRNHSGIDPDGQRVWWNAAASAPIGSLALNFGRFKDPAIDDALITVKTNADAAARKAAAEAISKEFGAKVWNLWLTWAESAVVSQPYVNGINLNKLPDGQTGIGLWGQQHFQPAQTWCNGGKCG